MVSVALSSHAADRPLSAAVRELKRLSSRLGTLFKVVLPVDDFSDLGAVKRFCQGPLTGSREHPWSKAVRELPLRERLSVSASLFLFRKTLPGTPASLSEWREKMSSPAPDPPEGFLDFCSRELKKIFPRGWDRGWRGAVDGVTLRSSSCLQSSRGRGGVLGMLARHEVISRSEFCEELRNKYSTVVPNIDRVRVLNALTDGKVRTVTVASADMSWLSPYHTLLYDHISQQEWCLRGEADKRKFWRFVRQDGELFVSGDYESATDNLNQDVARHIMETVNRRCFRVPWFVRDSAVRLLGCTAVMPDGSEFKVRRGQLMGNSMSFPLLCLQNYLAFRFLVPRESVPVRINGDDIVFRALPSEVNTWTDGVTSCGLTLSRGKTAVSRHWFSLNSTFFVAGTKRVREAPVIRSTCWTKSLESPSSLAGRMGTLKNFRPDRRSYLQASLLSKFSNFVWSSQRSLRRGHGIRVSDRALQLSGLREREGFYLSLSDKWDPPFLSCTIGYVRNSVPEGWVRVRRRDPVNQDVQRQFFREVVSNAWNPMVQSEIGREPFEDLQKSTIHFVRYPPKKFAKCLGISDTRFSKLRNHVPGLADKGAARWEMQ